MPPTPSRLGWGRGGAAATRRAPRPFRLFLPRRSRLTAPCAPTPCCRRQPPDACLSRPELPSARHTSRLPHPHPHTSVLPQSCALLPALHTHLDTCTSLCTATASTAHLPACPTSAHQAFIFSLLAPAPRPLHTLPDACTAAAVILWRAAPAARPSVGTPLCLGSPLWARPLGPSRPACHTPLQHLPPCTAPFAPHRRARARRSGLDPTAARAHAPRALCKTRHNSKPSASRR